MTLTKIILERRSIRKYLDKPIPERVINIILDAGRHAPSADNKQPWHFIVVSDKSIKEALSKGRWNTFVKESPITIVGCAEISDRETRKWSTIDTTIALENMVLAAWAEGVGSCWIGDFKQLQVKKLLEIPDDYKVIALITLGYPDEEPKPRKKKSLEKIVSYNKF